MKVLLVFAHPEPRSLNGALRDVAVAELKAQGHDVRVSDLYAEGWKSEIDRADWFPPTLFQSARGALDDDRISAPHLILLQTLSDLGM